MERRKNEADPLSAMNKYLNVKTTSDTLTRPSRQQLAVVRAQLDSTRQERAMEERRRAKEQETKGEGESKSDKEVGKDKEREKKDKKHKDKRDKDKKRRDKEKKKEETLERLRRERVARENEERAQLHKMVSPGGPARGPARDQYQARGHHTTGTRVERGGERMREDY
jgi:hypothetical protein